MKNNSIKCIDLICNSIILIIEKMIFFLMKIPNYPHRYKRYIARINKFHLFGLEKTLITNKFSSIFFQYLVTVHVFRASNTVSH